METVEGHAKQLTSTFLWLLIWFLDRQSNPRPPIGHRFTIGFALDLNISGIEIYITGLNQIVARHKTL